MLFDDLLEIKEAPSIDAIIKEIADDFNNGIVDTNMYSSASKWKALIAAVSYAIPVANNSGRDSNSRGNLLTAIWQRSPGVDDDLYNKFEDSKPEMKAEDKQLSDMNVQLEKEKVTVTRKRRLF